MFGSTNPFGQSSSPFGSSQSVFGQQNNSSNNPFAPKPFGSPTPFGSQTGNSMFGGSSTGVFGAAQTSSPFSSNTTFGASSSPAFGSSTPSFGAPSTPAFGNTSSSFGGSSVFGQKPAFGGFGSTPTQTSPFGSATQPSQPAFGSNTQQSQPAFGSSMFGSSTPFGASSQPAFGSTGTPAFGAPSTPAFGATSTPAFGATSTPAFGATTTPAFGATSTPAFGSTSTPAFGSTTTPAFGSTGSAFGMSNTSVFGGGGAFGASSSPVFGSSSTPAFGGASSSPAFGASSTPAFSFGSSTQAFGQSTSAFGTSSPFGNTTSAFGGQSSAFGSQTPTQAFGNTGIGQSGFGGQRGGSRVASYSATTETDGGSGQAGKLESISAMPVYKDKSHEELRWEDYQLGDKGGPLASPPQSTGMAGFNSSTTQTNAFGPSPTFGQTTSNPFSSTTPNSNNPFAPKTSTFTPGFGPSAPSFSSSGFGPSTSTAAPSIFGSSSSPFGSTFGASTSSTFGPSIFGNTQSSPLFNSTTPTNPQSGSTFGQNTSPFGQTGGAFSQPGLFSPPSSGLVGSIFSSSASHTSNALPGFGQTTPSMSTPFQTAQPAQSSGTFSFSNFGQTQPAQTSGAFAFNNFGQTQPGAGISNFGGTQGMFGQNNFGPQATPQNSMVAQPAPTNTNPFGTLPALPQMSIGRVGNTPSVQYGISSMPVQDKPAPVRISSVLTARHLSQRRIKYPLRKYKNEGSRVPFFSNDDDTPTTPKADALFIPRENPRALIICPMDQWPGKASEKASSFKDRYTTVNENGISSREAGTTPNDRTSSEDKESTAAENGVVKEQVQPVPTKHASNGSNEDHSLQKADMYKTLGGHRAGEAAIVYEHGADVEALMPKLRKSDYFTLPRIHELAAKERAEPGFCSHVKDFVVGRQGYGSIRFLGVTDVRGLDLESIVQFNNREVIVYMDDSKKPPVGQGLNKPAEVTLLNIKCFDKKTGQQYTGGPRIEKYKEMLKRKAEDQGAEFVSYDANKGEWKFRVNHFSVYKLVDEEDS